MDRAFFFPVFRWKCRRVNPPVRSPRKQCHGSWPCVAADGGSDVVDLYFSVQIGKAFLDKIRNGPRIVVAGGLGNVAFAGVGEAALGVFFHLVDDFFDDFFASYGFLNRGIQTAFVVHVEQRADTEEACRLRRRLWRCGRRARRR